MIDAAHPHRRGTVSHPRPLASLSAVEVADIIGAVLAGSAAALLDAEPTTRLAIAKILVRYGEMIDPAAANWRREMH